MKLTPDINGFKDMPGSISAPNLGWIKKIERKYMYQNMAHQKNI